MKNMTQSTLQMTDPVVPRLNKQASFLEKNLSRRRIYTYILTISIPLVIYFGIMYLATAITMRRLNFGEPILYMQYYYDSINNLKDIQGSDGPRHIQRYNTSPRSNLQARAND